MPPAGAIGKKERNAYPGWTITHQTVSAPTIRTSGIQNLATALEWSWWSFV